MNSEETLLVTGGTGSFGKTMLRRVLDLPEGEAPGKVIIFSRDEEKQFHQRQEFPDPRIEYFIGDVRDRESCVKALRGVDVVIHAAALKQVPAAEYNPFEAVKTNIIGAQNVINVAIDQNVKKVIALSTDKAASPVNLYGATKLCSDKLFIAGNAYAGGDRSIFSVVRYGNVLGSRGSVVPFFLKQKESGVLPITDPRMTRFWITLEHGVNLVLECFERMVGGELFVPKIPSMNIMDLAKAVCPECKTEIIGIRPGEKLHEVLIPKDESYRTKEYADYYLVKPDFDFFQRRYDLDDGKPVSEDFEYNSSTNPWRLSIDEMREMIEKL